jgi:hypothetical protein
VGLGGKLVGAGIVTVAQWEEAERLVVAEGGFVAAALVTLGFADAGALGRFLEEEFSIPTLPPGTLQIDREAMGLLPRPAWREIGAVPTRMDGGVLTVAVRSPLDVFVLDQVKRGSGAVVRPVFVDGGELERALAGLSAGDSETEVASGEVGAGGAQEMVAAAEGGPSAEEEELKTGDADRDEAGGTEMAQAEGVEEVLALLGDGLGWVTVVGRGDERQPFARALRCALEEGEGHVIYFSSSERPYGELELLDNAREAVLMVEDLDALEGHVPEQALLLQEIKKAHDEGSKVIVAASAPPSRLDSLEASLRVTLSLAKVFYLRRRVPSWMRPVLEKTSALLHQAGAEHAAEGALSRVRAGDLEGALSVAMAGCKEIIGRAE